MRLAHFGHSCVLAELNSVRVLFDPGTFSHGFAGITGLDAILITHQHPDHADPARLPALVQANPQAALYADPATAAQLGAPWIALAPGQSVTIRDAVITGGGGRHAVIHPEIPVIDNTVYLLGSADQPAQLCHPGDSLWVPPVPVDVLALPTAAPWMKISETVDYLRMVNPRKAFPIHQGILADAALPIYYGRFTELSMPGTEFVPLAPENLTAV